MKLMRIACYVDGAPSQHDGRFIVEYDPDGEEGQPRTPLKFTLKTTDDRAEAKRFTTEEAWETLRAQSKKRPIRPWDRLPNRPLTIFNVEIMDEDAPALVQPRFSRPA